MMFQKLFCVFFVVVCVGCANTEKPRYVIPAVTIYPILPTQPSLPPDCIPAPPPTPSLPSLPPETPELIPLPSVDMSEAKEKQPKAEPIALEDVPYCA
jgi:hypothetical protein